MGKLQEDYGNGIIDQITYQKLKKDLDRFSIANINLDETILVTHRPKVINTKIDEIKGKLIIQKLKEELDDDVFNFMKDDFESINLLASSLKTASSVEKAEILKGINRKQNEIDGKIQQMQTLQKLSTESASNINNLLMNMVSYGLTSRESDKSEQVLNKIKSTTF